MKTRRWVLVALAVTGAVVVGAFFAGSVAVATGAYPTRVRAVVVDSETGQPIADAWAIVPTRSSTIDDEWIAWQRRLRESGSDELLLDECTRSAESGPDGKLDLLVVVEYCRTLRFGEKAEPPPRFYGVERLVVVKDGYEHRVVDCTAGRWARHERRGGLDDPYATVDLGRVPLRRANR